MATYNPPVKDMLLALNINANIALLSSFERFADAADDMLEAILTESSRLASEVIAATNREGDEQGAQLTVTGVTCPPSFYPLYRAYLEGAWGSLQFEPEWGGQGMPFALSTAVMEMWQSANLAWSLCPLLTQGAVECLSLNADDALKQRYLPKMVSGEWAGTMNLTEGQAGSDLSNIRCKAQPTEGGYLISGEKVYITWGDHDLTENVIHLVLARLPDAPEGVRGISLFLVPKFLLNDDNSLGARNSVKAVSLEHKLGIHASPTAVMQFDRALGFLVGQENRGLACMFTMMNNARLGVGLQGVAVSERAYQQALNFANERIQSVAVGFQQPGPIIRHADVKRMLLIMKTLTEAGRALTYDACASLDFALVESESERQAAWRARAALLTPIVKGWCTEMAQEVTSLGIQVHGGMGYIEETGAAQYYRDARILAIYEGTNGIQALDLVGRKIQMDQGKALEALLREVQATVELSRHSDHNLSFESNSISESVDVIIELKKALLESTQSTPLFAQSLAYDYMMLLGYILGGWALLRQALAVEQQQADQTDAYAHAKRLSCRFYCEHVLPRYIGYASSIKTGYASIEAANQEGLASNWS